MAVNTVFGRSGDVVALQTDYATFYAPNGAHLPAGGTTTQALVKLSNANFDVGWVNSATVKGSDVVAGSVLLSVAPADPLNPIAYGQNDPVVEKTSNKVTTLSGATDVKYPSALLVQTSLGGKVDKQVALTPGTSTKITYNVDGLVTSGVAATTADIPDSTGKRYVTDTHLTNLGNLSGTNTGDQNLSGYATTSALATTNSNVSALSASLSGYATTAALATTNSNVSALTASLANYALASDLATTNSNLSALSTNVSTNYTPLTAHNALQTQVNNLSSTFSSAPTLAGPVSIDLVDSGTGTAPTVLYVDHALTGGAGSASVSHGAAVEFRGATTVANRTQAKIRTEWTNASDASRTANLIFSKVSSGTLSDFVWLRADGSLAVGNNLGGGFGTIWAQSGFQASGVGVVGQVLRDNGTSCVPATLNASDLAGQYESCGFTRTTTLDQVSTAETVHINAPVTVAGMTVGATYKLTAWGNMDNGTTAVLYTARLRWGNGGTIVIAPTVQGTTTALTNKSWRIEFILTITTQGASGTCRAVTVLHDHTTLSTGVLTTQEADTGATDITPINTTADTFLNLSWDMSTATGTPHVRTLGGTLEVIKR